MASLQKGKKVVNQDDLRRLMKEKKQSSERQKRVDSPHARYSSAGQLSCALCNAPVKSALLWQTHVLGKQHRDRVRDSADTPSSSSSSSALKRRAQESASVSGKRARSGAAGGQQEQRAVSGGLGLLAGHYDEDDDEDEDSSSKAEASAGLPLDFFDPSAPPAMSHSGSVSKADDEEEQQKESAAEALPEALPEGFFDDPVRDAKVRNVETPRDHMDREWEEFQKELRQVSSASEAIVAEEDEEGRLERQIEEIDQQIQCFRRVEALRSRQEEVRSVMRRERPKTEASAEEEEEEEELVQVLTQDWRAKGALT